MIIERGGLLDSVVIKAGSAVCSIYLFGATVNSWTIGDREHLWMSSLSTMDGSAPIRGGIPIAFPQFANQGDLMLHGFVRELKWDVLSTSASSDAEEVTLEVASSDFSRQIWDFSFRLQYKVVLTPNSLSTTLVVVNTDTVAWDFTACLHPYFRFPDTRCVTVDANSSLFGKTYIDKVDEYNEKVEQCGMFKIEEASRSSNGFVDRIYCDTSSPSPTEGASFDQCCVDIHYCPPVSGEEHVPSTAPDGFSLNYQQSSSFYDTVVFNPWIEGKKGSKGPDFDDDGYKFMLCVEPAVAAKKKVLQPNERFTGSMKVTVAST